MKKHHLPIACALALAACTSGPPPLHDDLGDSERTVSTNSVEAQAYFDRGLILCWGFNHDEAVLAFEEAIRLDPDCAMAWWGLAYALGPNINLPLTDEGMARRAHQAAQKALELADTASPVERALIEAMAQRFAEDPPAARSALDDAYARAMRNAWEQYPDDPEVGVIYADALMNLSSVWRRCSETCRE